MVQVTVQLANQCLKIDVILDARRAAAIPPPKGLGDRITWVNLL